MCIAITNNENQKWEKTMTKYHFCNENSNLFHTFTARVMVSFLSCSWHILLSFTYGYTVNESIICMSEFSIWEKSISSYLQ